MLRLLLAVSMLAACTSAIGETDDKPSDLADSGLIGNLDGSQKPVLDACVATTCLAEGAECGTIEDGCGMTLTCGTCTDPETCGGDGTDNVCGEASTCRPDGDYCTGLEESGLCCTGYCACYKCGGCQA